MEGILWIVGIWFGFYSIFWVFNKIGELLENRKRDIRNQVYKELVDDEKITKEIESYKHKFELIQIKDQTDEDTKYTYYGHRYPKYYGYTLSCPECETGRLQIRKGPYGKFFGCTNYPACKNKMSTKDAREEQRINNTKAFSDDFVKAFS